MSQPIDNLERLIAYASGALTGPDAASVEARLASDPEAAAVVARCRAAADAVRTDDSTEVPAEVIARAKRIFDPSFLPQRTSWLERLEQVVARVIFDSRVQPAVAGLRGAASGFQATFEIDEAEIDVHAEPVQTYGRGEAPPGAPGSGQWSVRGQVMTPAERGGVRRVALVTRDQRSPALETTADARGRFSFTAAPGEYDLYIELQEKTIRVPGMTMP